LTTIRGETGETLDDAVIDIAGVVTGREIVTRTIGRDDDGLHTGGL
jgi:hypothetical protein